MTTCSAFWLLPSSHIHGHVHETTVVLIRLPYFNQKHLDLFSCPTTASGKRAEGDGLNSKKENGSPVIAYLLQNRVLRPCPKRHVKFTFLHIDKPRFAHHVGNFALGASVEVNIKSPQALVNQAPVVCDGMVGVHGLVGRDRIMENLLRLEPAAGSKVSGKNSIWLEDHNTQEKKGLVQAWLTLELSDTAWANL